MENPLFVLSLTVFLPALGALILMIPGLFPSDKPDISRVFTLVVCAVVFCLTLYIAWPNNFQTIGSAAALMQSTFNQAWIPSFNINYFMGIDGISLPLVVLTSLISLLAAGASWSIGKHVKAYCVLFLLLETGMLGVFMALDFFLFYVFWEVVLLPMYFLIGVWGGPRREYAAIKFFLYTLVGSVLMLIAVLLIYFNSDLKAVAEMAGVYGDPETAQVDWESLHIDQPTEARLGRFRVGTFYGPYDFSPRGAWADDLHVQLIPADVNQLTGPGAVASYDEPSGTVRVYVGQETTVEDVVAAMNDNPIVDDVVAAAVRGDGSEIALDPDRKVHTFNLLALAAIGQHTDSFSRSLQWWAFLLLFVGFIIKVPSVPVHTWLPDAHVEAPTPISMILAGILLKMGGYGIIRICYPICPWGGFDLRYVVCAIGLISMVYGAFAAMAQRDFKRLVAYSSVSHMGYVVLGLGVWSVGTTAVGWNPDYWNMGIKGAMYQMIGHGISSAGMFFMVGVVYDRVHHRNLDEFGGLFGRMPVYTALSIGIFFAALGLPGLCGFIGEVLVVLSVWNFSQWMAIVAAAVVIITAAYILWTVQRVYLGVEYKGPHEEALHPINAREFSVALPLFVLAILLGVFPYQTVLRYMDGTIDRQTDQLTEWAYRTEPEWSDDEETEGFAATGSRPAGMVADADLTAADLDPDTPRLDGEAQSRGNSPADPLLPPRAPPDAD